MSRGWVAIALVAAGLSLNSCGGADSAPASETDQAVAAAKQAYEKAKKSGVDLEVGPCIAEQLPGLDHWVADVAHNPRTAADDDPANQCQRFRDGEAKHFVELTPEGVLIRTQ